MQGMSDDKPIDSGMRTERDFSEFSRQVEGEESPTASRRPSRVSTDPVENFLEQLGRVGEGPTLKIETLNPMNLLGGIPSFSDINEAVVNNLVVGLQKGVEGVATFVHDTPRKLLGLKVDGDVDAPESPPPTPAGKTSNRER
jgi:hypothetical protein